MQVIKKLIPFLIAILLFVCCTKEGDTIYKPNPDEEQPSTAPLVTVIYGPNSLGERSYCDKIYRGVEASASKHGIRTLHLVPENMEQGQTYLEMMFQQMESAQDSVRRLFIATSPVYDEFIRKNNRRLENNPNADLLYLETSPPLEGKGSTLYIDYYGAMYMAGCFSKYTFNFDLLLLILANPYTQSVVEAGEGLVQRLWDMSRKGELTGNGQPLPIVLIARKNTAEDIEPFWQTAGLTMPYSPQPDRKVYSLFAPRVIPRIYISDAQGIIRYMHLDMSMPSAETLAEEIKTLR